MTVARRGALALAWSGAVLFASSLVVFLQAYFVTFGRAAPPGRPATDVLVDVGLFSVFALHHSMLARTRAKALVTRVVPPALERSVYVSVASLLFMGVCLLWRPLHGELYRATGAGAAACYLVQMTGIFLTVRASSAIGALDLSGLRPVLADHTGGARRSLPLQTSGLYGFVRHPLYFAWILVVFGAPHMTTTRLVFALVSTAYLALAIPFEERGLIDAFGDEYRRYQRQVKWRMIPGVY
jgi:protein-S-isoprenylcysteine O-methyltransferase Ste14